MQDKENVIVTRHITSNTIINIGQCLFVGISVSGDGANGDCDVYDGTNAKAIKKFHIEVLSGTTHSISGILTKFSKGIYIVVNAVTTNVSCDYIVLPRK